MNLNRHAREHYALQIDTKATSGDPIPADAWQASFDNGASWFAAEVLTETEPWLDTEGNQHPPGDLSAWLVAGPRADEGDAVAVIGRSLSPLVRAIDNPEILVESALRITLT